MFGREDVVLATIGEYDDDYCLEQVKEEITEDHVSAAKSKTEMRSKRNLDAS
jgi:hypothetical protein